MTFEIRDRGRAEEAEEVYIPTAEEEADIEAGFAEIERGEYVDWDDVRPDRGTITP